HTIQSNIYIKDLAYFKQYFTDSQTNSSLPTNQSYRPLVTLSTAVDYWLAGNKLDPFYFHLSTFLWVILQGGLMFLMFRKVLKKLASETVASSISLFAVAWYVLHTANAETINYISARSDILSTIAVIGAMVVFQYASGKLKWLSLPIVALGVLVKPTAVMFAPILLVYFILIDGNLSINLTDKKFWGGTIRPLLTSIPVFAACGFFFWFTQHMESDTWVPGGNSPYQYLITQPFVLLRYFWTFFIPVNLSADTDWTLVESLLDYRFIVGILFLIALAAAIVYTSKKADLRPISFGLLWFVISLVPTSSVIPLSEVTNDHRMYFPFVGLALAATWLGYLILRQMSRSEQFKNSAIPVGIVLASVVLLGNSYGTYQRNKVWSSSESLWLDVTIKSPNNGRGLMNYGLAKMRKGDYPSAIDYFDRAFSTEYKNHPYLSINMAIAQKSISNFELAEKYYKESITKGYNYPDCHYFYAKWLVEKGDNELAKTHVLKALELSPAHEHARELLKQLETANLSVLTKAQREAKENPTAENHLNLSLQYYNAGEYENCINACYDALELKPDYPLAFNNICSAYNQLGQYEKAAKACREALNLSPDYQLAKNNLNVSLKGLAAKPQ
ncbi:MAG: tetratricopeptide repeat protein, partial [Flavobacteriales bacterium]